MAKKSNKAKPAKITAESIKEVQEVVEVEAVAEVKEAPVKVKASKDPYDCGWLTNGGLVHLAFPRNLDTLEVLKVLKNQEKIKFAVPLSHGEDQQMDPRQSAGFNGVMFDFPKNTIVNMPECIYLILEKSYGIKKDIGKDLKIDVENTPEALR